MRHITITTLFILSAFVAGKTHGTEDQSIANGPTDNTIRMASTSYLHIILPVIIDNQEELQLNDAQIDQLVDWQKENWGAVASKMQQIRLLQDAREQASGLTFVAPNELDAMQDDISRLQGEVLMIEQACQAMVFATFEQKNHAGLLYLLSQHGVNTGIASISE